MNSFYFNESADALGDLACERRRADTALRGVDYKREVTPYGVWEKIKISSVEGAKSIGRPIGTYDTLELERLDLIDSESIEDAKMEIAKNLTALLECMNIIPKRLLIAGLGNGALTPDAVGCLAASKIKPTLHIKMSDESFFTTLECSEIAVVTPGVRATSGLDSVVIIKGICDVIKPNAVIAIDSIAAGSTERLGSTIQISNTGIVPGSGLGNTHHAINEESVGVPVIAIGVPTVIDSRLLCRFGDEEENARGVTGMFVSPKEINEIVTVAAKIISGGINAAFGLYS
ncbi:MAG: GPR endopeptidase [Clostridia bacterium]|nr:GPR endopeptidase [Clostridia bacterium]